MYKVTLIPGDGVGPEIAEATRRCIDATGVKVDWDVQECGIQVIEAEGGVPDRVMESIRKNKVALKAPITTPIGKGFRSVNVFLRQELGLYACIRPCKTFKGVRTYYEDANVDLVLVRENTEDLYAGVEFKAGEPKTRDLLAAINAAATGKKINTSLDTTGISIKPISVEGTRNIMKYAFDYAVKNKRKVVSSVCKANIMKFTEGLWYDESRAAALAYNAKFEWADLAEGVQPDPQLAGKVTDTQGGIEYNERLIDNMCMQLVQKPELYDVIVTQNLYGDILSDLCAGLVGGLGVAPGSNVGPDAAIFEATHGSAPKYKGQNKVNPTALILSGKMLLDHLGEHEAAARLEQAVADVIAEGKDVTYDMKPDRNDPTAVGTPEMAGAICRRMESKRLSVSVALAPETGRLSGWPTCERNATSRDYLGRGTRTDGKSGSVESGRSLPGVSPGSGCPKSLLRHWSQEVAPRRRPRRQCGECHSRRNRQDADGRLDCRLVHSAANPRCASQPRLSGDRRPRQGREAGARSSPAWRSSHPAAAPCGSGSTCYLRRTGRTACAG